MVHLTFHNYVKRNNYFDLRNSEGSQFLTFMHHATIKEVIYKFIFNDIRFNL